MSFQLSLQPRRPQEDVSKPARPFAWRGQAWRRWRFMAAPARRARGLGLLALALSCLFAFPHPAAAAPADWVVLCPQDATSEPKFQDAHGDVFSIANPANRAIAKKACDPRSQQAGTSVNVNVVNNGAATIYVAFTNYSTQTPGQITWGQGCTVTNFQAAIAAGGSCTAIVPATAGISRFCASTVATPAGQTPNCNLAQARNQTMVETNFGTGANSVCFPTTLASCIWYDISVIPQNCTPQAWALNNCANAGGASYNLPVSLACSGQPTFTCKGPPNATPYGNANYPSNCGNPVASCVGNGASCNNAYFWPTPSPSPNAECQPGQMLIITFLAGS